MDELNQVQNPNVPSGMTPPVQGQPAMPQMPAKKSRLLFWIVLAVVIAVGGLAWWYISQMPTNVVVDEPQIDQEAREDIILNSQIQGTDLGNLDKEFEAIDKDVNSL